MKARSGSVPRVKRLGAQPSSGRQGCASSKFGLLIETPRVEGPIAEKTCSRSKPWAASEARHASRWLAFAVTGSMAASRT